MNSSAGILGNGGSSTQIINCYNTGIIKATMTASGIVGGGSDFTITNCYNTGKIEANGRSGAVSAGIAGNYGNVKYCFNLGEISGGDYMAVGIIAKSKNAEYCYNIGDIITSTHYAGGIATEVMDGYIIKNCYNSGNISNESESMPGMAAGIATNDRYGEEIQITNCHNTGYIQSKTKNEEYKGEIFGGTSSADIGSDCTYLIRESGNANANGATGKTAEEMESIMSLTNFINTINAEIDTYNQDTTKTPLYKWTIQDNKPCFVIE